MRNCFRQIHETLEAVYFVFRMFLINICFNVKKLPLNPQTRGSHCGGMVECRLRDPPQAENPVEQDSFLRKGSLVFLAKEQIPVQEADNDDTAEDIADGGRDQIVEDKGSDI